MSSDNYVGQGTLAPEVEQRVRSELSGGERLVCVGQPKPDLYRGSTMFLSIFGCCFGGFALIFFTVGAAMTVGFAGAGVAAAGQGFGGLAGCFPLVFCLFSLPFLLIGGCMATAPLWMPKRIRRIIYALTDRRALIFEPNWFGRNYTVRSYTRDGLGRMFRVDRGRRSRRSGVRGVLHHQHQQPGLLQHQPPAARLHGRRSGARAWKSWCGLTLGL